MGLKILKKSVELTLSSPCSLTTEALLVFSIYFKPHHLILWHLVADAYILEETEVKVAWCKMYEMYLTVLLGAGRFAFYL